MKAEALRRAGIAVVAAALSVLMVVDPFALGSVPAALAQDEPAQGDRAENFAEALAALPEREPAAATEITGHWPAFGGEALPALPVRLPEADEATVELTEGESVTVEVGGVQVTVAPSDEGPSPDAVQIAVQDPAETAAQGVTGVILEVASTEAQAEERGDLGDEPAPGDEQEEAIADEPVAAETEPEAPVADPLSPEAQSVELTVSYADFAGLGGGDWASRLRIVHLPDCAEDDADSVECLPRPLETVNDPASQTVTATVALTQPAGAPMVVPMMAGTFAVTAGASGAGGDWSQTGLSRSSSWGASGNMGAFSWGYPIKVPAPLSGLAPELSLSYSSAVSDGRVPSANNQAGWIGEGFDLTSSYIERQYKPCAADEGSGANNAGRLTADLCWGLVNATMVLKGASSELVFDSAANLWRSKQHDGTKVERLTGGFHGAQDKEYWKVTTTDGTQYFFGRGKVTSSGTDLKSAWTVPVYGNHPGESCYKTAGSGGFASSRCTQVWRWNLDHVVDPSGNTMTYFYETEQNAYVPDFGNNTAWTTIGYVAGGRLSRIEYGTRTDSSGSAPFRVVFDAQKRCVTNTSDGASLCANGQSETDKSKWLDTPADLQCTTSTTDCGSITPVFFDTTRLAKITAQAWDGTAYRDLDSWRFTQRFVGDGSEGHIQYAANISLRLEQVQHTGHGGTAATGDDLALPANQFLYTALPNRVDTPVGGQTQLWRHRVIQVRTEGGGAVHVGYRAPDCTPQNVPAVTDAAQAANQKLCYLVKWQPDGEQVPQNHWFHKYVVESIVEDGAPPAGSGPELITGSVSSVTRYVYGGGAKWVKPTGPLVDPADVTYSEFRGFAEVSTLVGEGTEQSTIDKTTYFRGTGATLAAGPSGHAVSSLDREEFAGQVFATQELNGTAKVSETITVPAAPVTVATGAGGLKSTRIPSTTSYGFTYNAIGSLAHRTSATTVNDDTGLPVTIHDSGDLTTTNDDVCTKIRYRRDSAFTQANMLAYADRTEVFGAPCDGTLSNATLISRTTTAYDNAGRPVEAKSVDPSDAAADITRSTAAYDAQGRLISTTDATGKATTTAYTFAAGGQVSKIVTTSPDPDGAGPVPAPTSTQEFNPLTGRQISTTDQNGMKTTAAYDSLGRLTSERSPQHQSAQHPTVAYSYLIAANGLNAVTTRTLGAAGQQHTSVVFYDGMGRPFQSQSEGLNSDRSDRGRMVSHLYYDSAGRTVRQVAPWWVAGAPAQAPVTPQAAPESQTTFVYDKAGRVTDEVLWAGTDSNPANERWRSKTYYDGATVLAIPPKGGTPTETVTDARGRITTLREYVRDPDTQAGATTPTAVRALASQITTYVYNAAGERIKMTDPEGNQWTYAYDLAGQLISSTDPDSGTTGMTYDVLGQVTTRTNANGQTLAYTYDALGRVTSLRNGSTTGTIRASWKYDTATFVGGGAALGQLAEATRVVSGKSYKTVYPTYDAAYRPTQVNTVLPIDTALRALSGVTYATNYTYTIDGQISQITYPQVKNGAATVLGAETVTTRYDAASMPEWMSGGFGWGTYVADAAWTEEGRRGGVDLGNTYGAAVAYDWDRITGRLGSVTLTREQAQGQSELAAVYTYDPAGNVTSIIDTPTKAGNPRDAQCFGYDGLRRLQIAWTDVAANCARTTVANANIGGVSLYLHEFTYDKLGNRLTKTDRTPAGAVTTTTYRHGEEGAGPHQLTSMSVVTGSTTVTSGFEWDAAGNMESRSRGSEQQYLVWDAEGKLETVWDFGEGEVNIYDPNGSRLVRRHDHHVTVFLPGGQEVTATASAVTATRWYSFAGATVAMRTGQGLGGVTSVVTDHHGTPLAHVHNTNQAAGVQRVRTDPFGAARSGAAGTLGGHGFLGASADAYSGLTLLGARFYDPVTGTFVSPDPLLDTKMPAQFNAYVYSGNNPVTWDDPSGLIWNPGSHYIPDQPAKTKKANNSASTNSAGVISGTVRRASSAYGREFTKEANALRASMPTCFILTCRPKDLKLRAKNSMQAAALDNFASIFKSEHGALIHGWATGSISNKVDLGPSSRITQGIRDSEPMQRYRNEVTELVKRGRDPRAGQYSAGEPGFGNKHHTRDAVTLLMWEGASDSERSLVTVGSFDLNATVIERSGSSAEVQFIASNSTSLGSALRFGGPELYQYLNTLPGETGPMSAVYQTYTWTETITW